MEKSWNITELCVLDIVHNVFQLDALNSSHQLSVEVSASEEADAIFDKISYGKGKGFKASKRKVVCFLGFSLVDLNKSVCMLELFI